MKISKVYYLSVIAILTIVLASVVSLNIVYAVDDLLALQGNVQENGVDLSSGNLTVVIFDAYSGGNIVYNSTTDFHNSIASGKYDVMLGNASQTLTLTYGNLYYMEVYINNEKLSFNGSSRQVFQSSTGNITLNSINSYSNIVMSNDSVSFSDGQNVSTGSGGWFKGLFNWVIGSSSVNYLSFNGSQLDVSDNVTRWLYNQTGVGVLNLFGTNGTAIYNSSVSQVGIGTATPTRALDVRGAGNFSSTIFINNGTDLALYAYNQTIMNNIFDQHLNRSSAVTFENLNVTSVLRVGSSTIVADGSGSLNITANTNFNGGWTNNGVSVINGDLFAQRLFVYNITSLSVNHLEVNGSVLPMFNNTFNIGNDNLSYVNAYLTGDLYINGAAVSPWLYNQTTGAINYVTLQEYLSSTQLNNTYVKIGSSNQITLDINNITNFLYNYNQTIIQNPFNQQLNTTNNVIFGNITSTGNLTISNGSNNVVLYVDPITSKVGIGTTVPVFALDVNITSGNYVRFFDDDSFGVVNIKSSNPVFSLQDTDSNSVWFSLDGSLLSIQNRTSALAWTSTPYTFNLNAPASVISFTTTAGVINEGGSDYDFRVEGVGAANALFVQGSDGKVGIGTASPQNDLHIEGASMPIIQITTTGNVNPARIGRASGFINAATYPGVTSTDLAVGTATGKNLWLAVGGVPGMVLNSTGNVGIGATIPTAKLHIYSQVIHMPSTTKFGTTVGSIMITPNGTNENLSSITFGGNSAGAKVDTAAAGIYVDSSSAYGTKMFFGTANSFANGVISRMMIDQNGNVGIGNITSPTQLLDVNGNVNISNSGSNISLGGGNIYWDSVNSRLVIQVS